MADTIAPRTELATLGGGCFWCLEAVFELLEGVHQSVSGFCGGRTLNPTYKDICYSETGHAEVIQLTFDPATISYRDLLQLFFAFHDPTTLNRQGNDVGTQYRSVIYYHDSAQALAAKDVITQVTHEQWYPRAIVTEVSPIATFYPAEAYHQGYYRQHPQEGYCQYMIAPKVQKLRQAFATRLKQG